MIVLVTKYGQLGNRLAYLRVYLAFAHEYNIRLLNLAFGEYARHFVCASGKMVTLPQVPSESLRYVLMSLRYFSRGKAPFCGLEAVLPNKRGHVDFTDAAIVKLCTEMNVIIDKGWPILSAEVLKKYDDLVKTVFMPIDRIRIEVERFVQTARLSCDLLIGIHIRQGDYRIWNNGIHFFHTDQYIEIMTKIQKLHSKKHVRFVVASNEPQDWNLFSGFDYLKSPGSLVTDMYVLAQCDEIYGPQSSFSGWASFYGNVPLCWIKTPESFEPALTAKD